MKTEIVLTIPYESLEEFETRQKQIFKEVFQEASAYKPVLSSQDSYITRKEAAKLLHISLPTLNELTKNGKLIGYRLQGRVLYKRKEVDESLTRIETLRYKRGQ